MVSSQPSPAQGQCLAGGAFVGTSVLNAGLGYQVIPAVGLIATMIASIVSWQALATDRRVEGAAS
jgi:predicted MFS family arabinose efflux permease